MKSLKSNLKSQKYNLSHLFGSEQVANNKDEAEEDDHRDMISVHMNQLGEVFSKYDKLVKETNTTKRRNKSAMHHRPPTHPSAPNDQSQTHDYRTAQPVSNLLVGQKSGNASSLGINDGRRRQLTTQSTLIPQRVNTSMNQQKVEEN